MIAVSWLLANKALVGKITGVLGAIVLLWQIHEYIADNAVARCKAEANAALIAKEQELRQEYEKQVQQAIKLQADEHQAF